MNLTTLDFRQLVIQWASANVDRIRAVWPLAGGWEAWAQAEVAAYINQQVPNSYVVREPVIYPDGGRADFLVNNPIIYGMNNTISVEMKCESLGNWANFVNGLRFDGEKLIGNLGPYQVSQRIAFGIFFSPESEQKLKQLEGFELFFTDDQGLGLAFFML